MTRQQAAELLAVDPDAPHAEVQRAFLRAARRVHPDVLPDAGEPERRAAAEAFDRLLHARDVLLAAAPAAGAQSTVDRGDPDGPRFRRVEGRGIGGSLVVLALLAFLLVLLVTVQQGVDGSPAGPGTPAVPGSSAGP